MASLLIVTPHHSALIAHIQAYPDGVHDVLFTSQMCTGTCTIAGGKVESTVVDYSSDVNFFKRVAYLFREVKESLEQYDLTTLAHSVKLDLTSALISDLSYAILQKVLLAERVMDLHKNKSYTDILFSGDDELHARTASALKRIGYPVMYIGPDRKPSYRLIPVTEKLRFAVKSLILQAKMTSLKSRVKGNILAYISTPYYAKKLIATQSVSITDIMFGVSSKKQAKKVHGISYGTLITWRSVLIKIYSQPRVKDLVYPAARKKTVISFFVSEALPPLYCKAQMLIDSYIDMLKKISPSVILVTMPSIVDCACLIITARALGIPVAVLNAGALTILDQYLIPPVDKYFAWGAYYRSLLIEKGVSERDIVVTGTPFNEMPHDEIEFSDKVNRIGIVGAGFLYGTGNSYWKLIADGLRGNFQNIEVIIRPRPWENTKDFYRMLVLWFDGIPYQVDTQGEVSGFIRYCDLIFHHNSTVGIEAILQGKPAIDVDLFGENRNAPFDLFTLPMRVKNSSDFIRSLKYFQKDKEWHKHFKEERKTFLMSLFASTGATAGRNVRTALSDLVPHTL